ncbi:MAG: hypothetical protein K6U14_06875 [Firmicutes bacterium]|nr:hypothetical protein [Alicyclobacillaceae bacterium]MCL6497342.1 hypothetical protein [Bacillota bacterium]
MIPITPYTPMTAEPAWVGWAIALLLVTAAAILLGMEIEARRQERWQNIRYGRTAHRRGAVRPKRRRLHYRREGTVIWFPRRWNLWAHLRWRPVSLHWGRRARERVTAFNPHREVR